jgi:hypothetical protein
MRRKMTWNERTRGWVLREQATGREYLWAALALLVVAAVLTVICWGYI